jgi:hypothetical protein
MGTLRHSPALILRGYLVGNDGEMYEPGVLDGVIQATPVFVSQLPDKRDLAICIYDTTGVRDGRLMRTGEVSIHPGVHLRVRAPDYQTGWEVGNALAGTLDGLMCSVIILDDQSYTLWNVSRQGPLLYLGEEPDKRREAFTLDAIMTVTETET